MTEVLSKLIIVYMIMLE